MKKFFKNIRKKSPARSGPPPGGSPVLGASRGSTASLVIGYDVREKELGKLHKAAWIGDLAKVQQLAKKDPSPLDKENRTPLHLACAQGHERIVQELLEWKAKTNIGDADSRTPLMKAVECRHENCVELLLRDRVELNSVDSAGNTSLHIAANDGSTKIVKMLCAAGANMTIKNKEGLTPLHVAVKEKHEDVCRVILSNRGQVDIEDNNLRTPLMYACQDGSITLVKLLLDSGASTEHRDAKGWSADDCAVIQGHHTCSQLISDHNHRQQRGSTASTPRSTAGSRSATPRGPSPFAMPPTPRGGDKDSASFGLPVADAGGDESGDETLSKASAKGAGSDSWGDDTDVSLAEDRKGKGDGAKINLAKLVGHLPSESDDGESQKAGVPGGGDDFEGAGGIKAKRLSNKSLQSETSVEENSWAAADSPLTPRRSAVRVSFKGDKELSEVHDITATESEAESDHYYSTIPTEPAKSPAAGSGYIPSAAGSGTTSLQLSPEKQREGKEEFMEDLGLGDVDDISEVSEASDAKPARPREAPPPPPPHSDSEWDSTVKSDPHTTPRPGILKKWNKGSLEADEEDELDRGAAVKHEGEDASDWDSTVAEETPAPPLPSSPQPKLAKVSEWEDDVERIVVPTPAGQIPKEVEVMMRRQQAEAQDTDEDDSSSQHNDVKAVGASDLLSVTIEQSAKEYLGNDSLDTTPQGDALDKPSQDSEWDSTVEAVTPRAAEPVTREQVAKQESDWDSTAEAVTPRAGAGGSQSGPQKPSDDIILSDEDDLEAAVAPSAFAPPIRTGPPPVSAKPTVASSPKVTLAPAKPMAGGMAPDDEDEDEESGWDSDGDMLPSDAAPPLPVDAKQQQKQQQEGLSDTDDEMEKTETISEWEVERKQAKEYRGHVQDEGDDDFTDLTEAGRTQPFIPQLQQQQAEAARQAEEEQERKKKEEEEEEQQRRQQQWEREEAARQERLRAEAEEALRMEQEAMGDDDKASSEDDSLAHEEYGKPVPSPTHQMTRPSEEVDSCQHNSSNMASTTVSPAQDIQVSQPGEELKRIEEQVREEARAKEVAALIASSSATTVSGRPSQHSTSSGAQVVLHPQPSQGLPQQSNSGSYLTGPTALQIKQRLQIGSGNPHMAYHSDGMESDDSLASDNERPDNIHSYYPTLGSTQSFRPDFNMADDDILSYTSTEFENGDLVPASTGPFSRDVLLNMNLSDPSTLVQVQDYIRETKRHMEQERNQRAVLENKLRLITKEKQDMQRKLDSMSETRQALEQNKLDLEAKIRSLEYNFSEEQEKRCNAELLLTKTKEQLARKEQNFTSELEAKQRAELTMRNIQLEMRAAQNTIKELEEEREELERQLQHEHNARMLQEQINEEQSRLAQQRHQETMASAMAASRLEARPGEDGTDGEGRGERDKLNAELYAIKMEMDRQRSRFKDEITLMATENEELQSRVEELKSEIKLNEEALAHATMQYNMQLGTLRSEGSTAAAAIEKERAAREKLEAELESLQKRLLSANTEKDRAVQARNELEHDYQREKQSALRDKERKDEELAMLKDNNQHLSQRLHTLETKLNAMENELHVSNTSLMERTNQLQQLRQEADRHKQAQENFDTNIRLEKELNTKLQVKIESLQEKLSQSQHEVLSLKQQVENLRTAGLNSSSADSHEQLTAIMASLRADSDRSKAILEERSNNLMEQVQHLKEEARNADNRRNTLEADLRRLQTEHTEVRHKLSLAEAQLQMMQKAKDQLEQERGQLKLELEKATEKQHASQEKAVEAQARVAELTERLDRAERASQLSTQNLATTSASYNAVARTKDEMEDTLQRLQVENARLDSDLRHERERAEMLQAELTDSYKVRSSLEALCSNLKSTTAHLEEKLGEEAATRVVLAHEARDSKNLLDQELAARRHLGLKIVKLERAQKHAEVKVQEAKKSSSEAEGHKSVLESQLMEESQKNQQLQKEVTNLKSLLKAAKKKMKDTGVAPSPRGENGHYAEFQREVSAEGGKVSTPRGDSSNHHHYHHVVKSADFEHETRNNTLYEQTKPRAVVIDPGEVTSIQTSVKQLERCVRQLETKVWVERVQSQVDGGFVDVEGLQQDMETKYRRELNRKLEEVNAYLETQTRARDRLDSSRSENEARLTADKRRLEEENSNLRLQYEQALAQRESREMEARRFKQLYESEMQWRMRLSDQLQQYADRSVLLKPRFTASDRLKSRLHGSVGNLNMSAMSDASVNVSRINGDRDEALSNKIRAELDRSIAKHLEAAPHSDIVPVIRETEGALLNQSLAKSSKDYIEILKRKYCV